MTKIAVTGHKGFIGSALVESGCIPIISDITDYDKLKEEIADIHPDVVIHTAAKTNVDWCEANEGEAFRVNVRGTSNVELACHLSESKMIYLSSFQVFYGSAGFPYNDNAQPRPRNVYGYTKWMGELVLSSSIFNTSKSVRLGSVWSEKSIKPTLQKLVDTKVEFPTFQIRSYIPLWYVVQSLKVMAEHWSELPWLVNLTSVETDTMSCYEFWHEFMEQPNALPRDYELGGMVARPHNGSLDGTSWHRLEEKWAK